MLWIRSIFRIVNPQVKSAQKTLEIHGKATGGPAVRMTSPSASKVVLKSTTKLSLNERFTNMLKNKHPMPVNIRATMQQQSLASARNRRLAQQMENRPSVQAALKLKQSLKQRLGKSNIQARLGRPLGGLQRGAGGMRGAGMGLRGSQRGIMRVGRGGRGMQRGAMIRGASILLFC
ncbi:unnamed protein product [Ranitomeya imitator]|uniref:Uncharacterized protein n=1 Tax=Ranitomeya imitator TaxID=111125 RepID=A0ABN9LTT3_9NEOB|nr:unnamed protein product [Ranitomeya imitator]